MTPSEFMAFAKEFGWPGVVIASVLILAVARGRGGGGLDEPSAVSRADLKEVVQEIHDISAGVAGIKIDIAVLKKQVEHLELALARKD